SLHARPFLDAGERGGRSPDEEPREGERGEELDQRPAAFTLRRTCCQPFAETVTRSRSRANERSPMPRTLSSSSTFLKGPCSFLYSTIRCAIAGPTPGSLTRVSTSAVLTSMGACFSSAADAAWLLARGWAGAACTGEVSDAVVRIAPSTKAAA